jgi:biopolymer transport protein ExbB/TolQ
VSAKRRSFASIVLASLGWPLFLGLLLTVVFYALIAGGIIRSELVSRYFAGHPVEYIETTLFFIGVVALLLKGLDLAYQFQALPTTTIPVAAKGGDDPERANELLDSVDKLPSRTRKTYFARRVSDALRHVKRSGSNAGMDSQLRHLSDMEAERSHEDYALVRMIIWATPMLGFLGTVIGITLALGDLSPEALVNAPKEAMQGLLAGLSIAFDTTALALSLSIVLMFIQYLIRQVETQLLTAVDRRAEEELVGRFQQLGTSTDPNVESIKRMSTQVVESVERLVDRQAELWGQSVSTAQQQWIEALTSTQDTVQTGFHTALSETMLAHADALVTAEELANQRAASRWENMYQALQQQTEIISAQQAELRKQNEVMAKVVEATGEISHLETALNGNLAALAGSKNFEDTVMSLSATIQLLTSRLGVAATKDYRLHAEESPSRGHAA